MCPLTAANHRAWSQKTTTPSFWSLSSLAHVTFPVKGTCKATKTRGILQITVLAPVQDLAASRGQSSYQEIAHRGFQLNFFSSAPTSFWPTILNCLSELVIMQRRTQALRPLNVAIKVQKKKQSLLHAVGQTNFKPASEEFLLNGFEALRGKKEILDYFEITED